MAIADYLVRSADFVRTQSVRVALAVLLAVVLIAAPALANQGPDASYERARQEELAKLDPTMVPVWDRANTAREAGKRAEAVAAYEEVTKKVPTFAPAFRRLCSVQESHEAAVNSCRAALRLQESWESELALASVLMREFAGRPEARGLLVRAELKAPREPGVAMKQAELALIEEDPKRFFRYADGLQQLAPDAPETALFGTIAALYRGDADVARASFERAKARSAVDPKQLESLERAVVKLENAWTPARVAKYVGVTIAIWLLLIAGLFIAGTRLSEATLSATAKATGVTSGEAVGGTRAIRRAYALLISLASILFYVSLPLVAAIVLVAVGGIIYFFLAIGRIPVKLVLIVGFIGLASLWAILKGIFIALRPPKSEDPGEDISLSRHPRLAALLANVAARIGTRSVDRVFLTAGTEMAVYERGGLIQTAQGKGERCLVMGVGLLRGMRVGGLKGVLAHEFGHFKNEDTAGGTLSLAVRRSMMHIMVALAQNGAAGAFNPAWIFTTRYHQVFLRISQGASRLQEVLADRWAVVAFGSKPFVDGFAHVITRNVEHAERTQNTLREVIDGDVVLTNLYTYEPSEPLDAAKIATTVQERLEEPADPYDSHPRPKDRIAAALALAIEHTSDAEDGEDAWHLFDDRADLEERLTDRIREAVAANHAVVIRKTAAPKAA